MMGNHTAQPCHFDKGDRFVQVIFSRAPLVNLFQVANFSLSSSERGIGGFGSTGETRVLTGLERQKNIESRAPKKTGEIAYRIGVHEGAMFLQPVEGGEEEKMTKKEELPGQIQSSFPETRIP